ncbi:unnamed protein product [Spirodela intermedia]|uniref:Uncharacterized protein n=1 Tax=Spirodela intermedia TaxID=51605 RepID=A0A7I8I9E3_SPIIN|nr:unnamed protein product [Spirodela intermedia]CAA6654316.1 unnamed protein product [Spirodela intermedia]
MDSAQAIWAARSPLMVAPMVGLALPRRTPHPVVWGQLASSQRPIMGRTALVSWRTSPSELKALPTDPSPPPPLAVPCRAARHRARFPPARTPTS